MELWMMMLVTIPIHGLRGVVVAVRAGGAGGRISE
jgi:hypothetical protein